MARQRTLERAGWRIWRCFASRFVREREAVIDELTDLLSLMDIRPRSSSERSRTYTELREWSSTSGDVDFDDVGADEDTSLDAGEAASTGTNPDLAPLQPVVTPSIGSDPAETMGDRQADGAEIPASHALTATQRVTEAVVQAAILELLGNGEVWTNAELKQALSRVLPLSAGDRQRSPSRPKEEKWEELVNNALTRSGRSNSLYARGLVSNVGFGRYRIANET
jgi:hypothetical protein